MSAAKLDAAHARIRTLEAQLAAGVGQRRHSLSQPRPVLSASAPVFKTQLDVLFDALGVVPEQPAPPTVQPAVPELYDIGSDFSCDDVFSPLVDWELPGEVVERAGAAVADRIATVPKERTREHILRLSSRRRQQRAQRRLADGGSSTPWCAARGHSPSARGHRRP